MPNLSFTNEEIAQAAGKDPWRRQREFSEELDPDDMAETAATYRQAAAEAGSAGELAEKATEVATRGGHLDGRDIVDGQDRIDHTARGLQGNGEDMDEVVSLLVRSMNWAIDEEEKVGQLVYGDGGLDEAVSRHNTASVNEWNGWQEALETEVAALGNRPVTVAYPALPISYGGRSYIVTPAMGGVYTLPASLAEDVRKRHLESAAEDATETDGEIADEIEHYRRRLGDLGTELATLGYDLSGPLGLWTTEEMAEYNAEMLRKELAKPDPDWDKLDMYTQGLEGITNALYGVPPDDEAARGLTTDELAYLNAFFSGLDANTLVSLGEKGHTSMSDVANGINMLTNPDIFGIDPATERDEIPAAIRPFIYDYEDSGIFDDAGMGEDFARDLGRFNAFGEVMKNATIPPGEQMAHDMARAAVDIQEQTSVQYKSSQAGGYDPITNTVSSGLLQNVALNTEASAGLLNDDDFRQELLGQRWETGWGVAEVVQSGTTIPEGVDPNGDEAGPYVQAAHNVLSHAAANPDDIHGKVDGALYDRDFADHTPLEGAVGDTALTYLDMVADESQNPGFFAGDSPTDFTDENLFGKDHRYSFNLSDDERRSLFSVMAGADPDTRDEFFHGVGAWERITAQNAFERAEAGESPGHDFAAIGRVSGTAVYAQDLAGLSGDARSQASTIAGIASAGAAIKDLTPAIGGKIGVIAGTYGIAEATRHSMGDPMAAVEQARLDALNYGDQPARILVADAAVAADYQGAGDMAGTRPDMSGADSGDDLSRWLEDVESGRYEDYWSKLDAEYKEAIG
jgi:hypothetical protein